ncbi:MAG: hypothetical protein IPK00_02145 [Deltaproteobacteria bacterium]|nr:hypothetical protein [Deltaproteobacteria bacterium]
MSSSKPPKSLHRGDLVRVRSREEILTTLDERGRVDGMPFMPEMLPHCGQTFRVEARAHKTCDTINKTGGRRMNDAVHLEGLRCDGSAHGGCQAGCLFFFKNVWLERVDASGPPPGPATGTPSAARPTRCSEATLAEATRVSGSVGTPDGPDTIYSCQITELFRATSALPWWDVRQYVEDVTSGNVGLLDMLNRLFFRFTANVTQVLPGYRLWLGLYDRVQALLGKPRYPVIQGMLKKTPSESQGLGPGDRVRVKPLEAIVKTLDVRNRNRGMAFDKEQSIFCGEQHVVQARVEQIIDEPTGKMMKLPNDCLILKDVACRSCYSEKRIGCPRAIYSYWRECWLERAEPERS